MRLELVLVPVSDVDRAKAFYVEQAGFNADHDQVVSDGDPLRSADAARLGGLDRDRPRPHRDDAGGARPFEADLPSEGSDSR